MMGWKIIIEKPFYTDLQLSSYESTEFLEALRKAAGGKSMDAVEGELFATKHHLSDMRDLVFKKEVKE